MNPCIPHHKVVKVLRVLIISESEVSITAVCLLFSPCYTAVRINNCLKSILVIKVTMHYEKYDSAMHPSYCLKFKYPLPFSVSYV